MRVANLWRHPIKAHGREALDQITLTEGKTMPFDRVWAIAHEAAKLDWDNPEWAPCTNFSRNAKAPSLMAITSTLDEKSGLVTLSHPTNGELSINPDTKDGADALIDWVKPLCPPNRAQPTRIFRVADRGLTDTDFPSVSINSHTSLSELSKAAGQQVSDLRFRGNIWLDDLEPWAELNWIGREIQIGESILKPMKRTTPPPALHRGPHITEAINQQHR